MEAYISASQCNESRYHINTGTFKFTTCNGIITVHDAVFVVKSRTV